MISIESHLTFLRNEKCSHSRNGRQKLGKVWTYCNLEHYQALILPSHRPKLHGCRRHRSLESRWWAHWRKYFACLHSDHIYQNSVFSLLVKNFGNCVGGIKASNLKTTRIWNLPPLTVDEQAHQQQPNEGFQGVNRVGWKVGKRFWWDYVFWISIFLSVLALRYVINEYVGDSLD